jgi:hypothetical protein
MTTALYHPTNGHVARPSSSSLADVIDIILDKGMVIDAYIRVSLVGIELLTIDARIVIASVDTYLRFAEAVNRLQIGESGTKPGLPELVEGVSHTVSPARHPMKALKKPMKALKKPFQAAKHALTGNGAKSARRRVAS